MPGYTQIYIFDWGNFLAKLSEASLKLDITIFCSRIGPLASEDKRKLIKKLKQKEKLKLRFVFQDTIIVPEILSLAQATQPLLAHISTHVQEDTPVCVISQKKWLEIFENLGTAKKVDLTLPSRLFDKDAVTLLSKYLRDNERCNDLGIRFLSKTHSCLFNYFQVLDNLSIVRLSLGFEKFIPSKSFVRKLRWLSIKQNLTLTCLGTDQISSSPGWAVFLNSTAAQKDVHLLSVHNFDIVLPLLAAQKEKSFHMHMNGNRRWQGLTRTALKLLLKYSRLVLRNDDILSFHNILDSEEVEFFKNINFLYSYSF